MSTPEAPDQTVTASQRASEVIAAYKALTAADDQPSENAKHLWSLAYSMVADIHRGADNKAPEK
jgi:hypothetical protein